MQAPYFELCFGIIFKLIWKVYDRMKDTPLISEFLCNECRKEQDHIFDQKMEILSMVEAE